MSERMHGGELQTVREYLGLTLPALAGELGVREDTLRKWEAGKDPIPLRVRDELCQLEDHTAAAVAQLVETLQDEPTPAIVAVYRDPDAAPATRPDVWRFGPRWWRHVVARAISQVPDAGTGWPSEIHESADQSDSRVDG